VNDAGAYLTAARRRMYHKSVDADTAGDDGGREVKWTTGVAV
jgi:hypothetical protein